MFTVASLNIYCAVLLITEPESTQAWWGIRLGCRCLSPFHLHSYSSGGSVWPSVVITEPWCDAAEADSDNRILYPESPWGLVKLPLMNFSLPRHHYCYGKDGDNYLIYYPEAAFILGQ